MRRIFDNRWVEYREPIDMMARLLHMDMVLKFEWVKMDLKLANYTMLNWHVVIALAPCYQDCDHWNNQLWGVV